MTCQAKKKLHQFLKPPNFFPETRVGFRHWVTGITKPNNRGKLRYDLHDN